MNLSAVSLILFLFFCDVFGVLNFNAPLFPVASKIKIMKLLGNYPTGYVCTYICMYMCYKVQNTNLLKKYKRLLKSTMIEDGALSYAMGIYLVYFYTFALCYKIKVHPTRLRNFLNPYMFQKIIFWNAHQINITPLISVTKYTFETVSLKTSPLPKTFTIQSSHQRPAERLVSAC